MSEVIHCSCCKGKGALWMKIRSPRGGSEFSDEQYVTCPAPFCNNGVWDREAYYQSWKDWGKPGTMCRTCCT